MRMCISSVGRHYCLKGEGRWYILRTNKMSYTNTWPMYSADKDQIPGWTALLYFQGLLI